MANQGLYHPTYNPNGSKKASDNNFWYNTTVSFNSLADCFDPSKLLSTSGNIGTVSGRPDGLFYDQIHESSILDLRMSSQKVEDYNRLIDREFNKLVAGTNRGKEGEYITLNSSDSSSCYYKFDGNSAVIYGIAYKDVKDGGNIRPLDKAIVFNGTDMAVMQHLGIFNGTEIKWQRISGTLGGGLGLNIKTNTVYVLASLQTTRTKSNTITHCDIIGSPANYPTAWKQSGVSGVPLIVAEDGSSLLPTGALTVFKLSRKANATPLQVLKSTDSGATWTALAVTTGYTFSTITNAITFVTAPATTDLIMVTYQTHTNMAVAGVNSEVLTHGDVHCYSYYTSAQGLNQTLINKVNTNTIITGLAAIVTKVTQSPYHGSTSKFETSAASAPLTHNPLSVVLTNTQTVKMLPYLTRNNGRARLQLVFKEMKYNGTSWGDDSKFNIVDNVSTTTDTNGATVLIGQKYAELPYFISSGE